MNALNSSQSRKKSMTQSVKNVISKLPYSPKRFKKTQTTTTKTNVSYAPNTLAFFVAEDEKTIRDIQLFRAKIFGNAYKINFENNIDHDVYDDYSVHVLVRDLSTGQIVACTRIIRPKAKKMLGKYYSEHEFDLSQYLKGKKRVYELGRTCADPAYRGGKALSELWLGMIPVIVKDLKAKHLIGCVSINLDTSLEKIHASEVFVNEHTTHLKATCIAPFNYTKMYQQHGMPENYGMMGGVFKSALLKKHLPSLLTKYQKLGAKFSTTAFHDVDFNSLDYCIAVKVDTSLVIKAHLVCQLMNLKRKFTPAGRA